MFMARKMSILSTLVFILIVSNTIHAQTQVLEDVLLSKQSSLETLWEISMNRLKVEEAQGEVAAENWDNIKTSAKDVREVSALIVRNNETMEIKLINMNMGTKSSGSLYFNTPLGFTIIGRFHTHPYSYKSLADLPFSPRDVVDLYTFNRKTQLKNEYFSLIRSGAKYFALVIEDQDLALAYYREQEALGKNNNLTIFDYLYKKFYSRNDGSSIQEIQLNSLRLITGESSVSGLGLYEVSTNEMKKLN